MYSNGTIQIIFLYYKTAGSGIIAALSLKRPCIAVEETPELVQQLKQRVLQTHDEPKDGGSSKDETDSGETEESMVNSPEISLQS